MRKMAAWIIDMTKLKKTGADISEDAPKKTAKGYSVETLLSEIQNRCAELNYISETDSPAIAFRGFHEVKNLTADFLRSINRHPSTRFETKTFAEFFDRPIRQDSRWKDLMLFLEANLANCTVFKVGKIQVDYYAAGLFGNLPIGVFIYSTET